MYCSSQNPLTALFRLPADWPRDGAVLEERVLQISYDPMRDAQICMTAYADKLRWQVRTVRPAEKIGVPLILAGGDRQIA